MFIYNDAIEYVANGLAGDIRDVIDFCSLSFNQLVDFCNNHSDLMGATYLSV